MHYALEFSNQRDPSTYLSPSAKAKGTLGMTLRNWCVAPDFERMGAMRLLYVTEPVGAVHEPPLQTLLCRNIVSAPSSQLHHRVENVGAQHAVPLPHRDLTIIGRNGPYTKKVRTPIPGGS
jgi:hypothetical protein